jgi:cytochrome c-type biogenesis protein CcmH
MDKRAGIFTGLLVLITLFATAGLYLRWGALSGVLDQRALATVNQTFSSLLKQPQLSPRDLEQAFEALEEKLSRSAPALARLGELSLQLGWYDKSIQVFEKAYQRDPTQIAYKIQLLYAQTHKHQGKLPPELLATAREINAQYPQYHALTNILAIDAYFSEDYVRGIHYWQKLLIADESLTPERRLVLENAIQKSRDKLAAASKTRFRVTLTWDPALQAALKPTDSVFVVMKAWSLDIPPLYVMKCSVADLPTEIVLDDRSSMIEKPNFDVIRSVEIIAKLSPNGDALADPAEIRTTSGQISVVEGDNLVHLRLTAPKKGDKDV